MSEDPASWGVLARFSPHQHITGDDRVAFSKWAVERYTKDGWSFRRISRESLRSYGFVRDIMVESGVPLKSRGSFRATRQPLVDTGGT